LRVHGRELEVADDAVGGELGVGAEVDASGEALVAVGDRGAVEDFDAADGGVGGENEGKENGETHREMICEKESGVRSQNERGPRDSDS